MEFYYQNTSKFSSKSLLKTSSIRSDKPKLLIIAHTKAK